MDIVCVSVSLFHILAAVAIAFLAKLHSCHSFFSLLNYSRAIILNARGGSRHVALCCEPRKRKTGHHQIQSLIKAKKVSKRQQSRLDTTDNTSKILIPQEKELYQATFLTVGDIERGADKSMIYTK